MYNQCIHFQRIKSIALSIFSIALLTVISACTKSIPTPLLILPAQQINVLVLGQSNATFSATWESFSFVLAQHQIGVYLINAAKGSTRLMAEPQDWLPPDGKSYRSAASLYLKHRPPLPEIDFILWQQGEADAANLTSRWESTYSSGLTSLILELEEVVQGDWMFLSALIPYGRYAPRQAITGINKAMINHPMVDEVIDFGDQILSGDGVHYAFPAILGERWAQLILTLLDE